MTTGLRRVLGMVAACAMVASGVNAQPYVVRTIDPLPDGTPLIPYAVTDRDEVVGYIPQDARRMYGPGFAILPEARYGLAAGLHVNGDTPTPQAWCTGVNLERRWVGSTIIGLDDWWRQASVFDGTTPIFLDRVGDVGDNVAADINDNNETAGVAVDGRTEPWHRTVAVRWDAKGQATILRAPDGFASAAAYGLNDSGWVVGIAVPESGKSSFAWSYYYERKFLAPERQPVLWIEGRPSLLAEHVVAAPAGLVLERARDVSNFGWIVGDGSDASGIPVGCVLVPAGADLNADTLIDSADAEVFLKLYQKGSIAADYTADGVVNAADVAAFLALFQARMGVGERFEVPNERQHAAADLWLSCVNTPNVPSPPHERGVFDLRRNHK